MFAQNGAGGWIANGYSKAAKGLPTARLILSMAGLIGFQYI